MPGIFPGQNVQNGAVNRGLRFWIGAERPENAERRQQNGRNRQQGNGYPLMISSCQTRRTQLVSVNSALRPRNGPDRARNGPNLG